MRYHKTRLVSLNSYTSLKSAPLDIKEMILKQVNRDEASEHSVTHQNVPKSLLAPHTANKKSVHWLILFKTAVMEFRP